MLTTANYDIIDRRFGWDEWISARAGVVARMVETATLPAARIQRRTQTTNHLKGMISDCGRLYDFQCGIVIRLSSGPESARRQASRTKQVAHVLRRHPNPGFSAIRMSTPAIIGPQQIDDSVVAAKLAELQATPLFMRQLPDGDTDDLATSALQSLLYEGMPDGGCAISSFLWRISHLLWQKLPKISKSRAMMLSARSGGGMLLDSTHRV